MATTHPQPTLCDATRAMLRAAHVAWLHPKGGVGRVWIGRKGVDAEGDEIFEGETVDPAAVTLSPAFANADYSSLNTFWGRRRSGECLKSVGSTILDFDYNKAGLRFDGWAPEAVRDVLVEAMAEAGVPLPSIWVATGRNLQATYGCDGVKAAAWARVEAIYDALHGPDLATNGLPKAKRKRDDAVLDAFEARMLPVWRLFRDAGLDRVCRDGARVVRLVGSVNAKSGVMARLLGLSSFGDAVRYDFHALADAILPLSRAEILERRRVRAEAKAAAPANDNPAPAKPRRHAGPTGRWTGILRDLHAWRDGMGAPPVGMRELWIFLTANATAHVRGGCREDWAAELAPLAGLSEREAFRALGTLDRRQRRHEAGETDEHKGVEQSPLYNYSAATIVDLLDVQVEQAEAFGLRALFPGGGKALTPAERQRASRDARNPDRVTRSGQVEDRITDGGIARLWKLAGLSLDRCAQIVGRSRSGVAKAIAEAEAAPREPGVIPLDEMFSTGPVFAGSPEAEALVSTGFETTTPSTTIVDASDGFSAVHDTSRYIVVSASRELPVTLPEPEPVRVTRVTPFHAVVETASAVWTWTQTEDVWGRGRFDTWFLEAGTPTPADAAMAEAARRELAGSVVAAPRRARRAPIASKARHGVRGRLGASRPLPVTAADRQREVDLYREASGG
ncbi:hypothetical protein [Methylorubrum extorquens]|uniref:hypothetical protein n=1 Tax=Methylorubrum extorquens TaxID=408 RepID=UPI001EE5D646|nr:hypothetical protein [Methylorubrum extorquens]MCG5246874.1 hypothetical protein [Methylorubrum extorquens]